MHEPGARGTERFIFLSITHGSTVQLQENTGNVMQSNNGAPDTKKPRIGMDVLALVLITAGISSFEIPFVLTGTSVYFLLFHVLAESFSIAILTGVFIIGWNTRNLASNSFFLVLGTSSLFVAVIDLFHMLAYKGMGLFAFYVPETNLPTQLWLAARYFQAITILIALLLARVKINPAKLLFVLAASCASLLAVIFIGLFPMAHDGSFLTLFKISSEYVIIGLLCAAMVVLKMRKPCFDRVTYYLTIALLVLLCASEATFTLYTDVFGFFNMLGHVIKIVAAAVIYKAIIEVTLQRPMDSLFKAIKDNERVLEHTNTTLSTVNARLEREIEERTRAQRTLNEFLSMVTHELRSPLTVLWQSVQNLVRYKEKMSHEQHERIMDGIARNIVAMDELVADISTISHMDEKRFALVMDHFNLRNAIGDVLKALDVVIKHKHADVIVDMEEGMMMVADQKRVKQVIKILLDNALNYSADGVRIIIKAWMVHEDNVLPESSDAIRLQVSDTGMGVDESFLPRIFERFARSERTKGIPGTGLGLCIAKEIATMHGGTISMCTRVGAGTEVTVTLPKHPKTKRAN